MSTEAEVRAGDRVFKALADASRRRILDLLRVRARTTGELAESFDFTRFAVMKHLRVLEGAGLVTVVRRGRVRWNHLNPVPIREIQRRWLAPFAEEAADALLRLRDHVEGRARVDKGREDAGWKSSE